MFMVETPSFDKTTQQAVVPLCRMEETSREAGHLPKKQAPERFIQTPRRTTHTGPHSFLKLVSHVLTTRGGTESMGYGHYAQASRDACV
jgi:hypothetical protein